MSGGNGHDRAPLIFTEAHVDLNELVKQVGNQLLDELKSKGLTGVHFALAVWTDHHPQTRFVCNRSPAEHAMVLSAILKELGRPKPLIGG